LHVISSELGSTSANLVGFSVILFAYLNIVAQCFPRVSLEPPFLLSGTTFRYIFIYVILSLISTVIIFALMRIVIWGRSASEIIRYENSATSIRQLWKETSDRIIDQKFFKVVRLEWFAHGMLEFPVGFWLSLGVSSILSLVFILTFLFY